MDKYLNNILNGLSTDELKEVYKMVSSEIYRRDSKEILYIKNGDILRSKVCRSDYKLNALVLDVHYDYPDDEPSNDIRMFTLLLYHRNNDEDYFRRVEIDEEAETCLLDRWERTGESVDLDKDELYFESYMDECYREYLNKCGIHDNI